MPQGREIVLRATAVSGVMTNFLTLLAEKDGGFPCKAMGTPTAELTLRIRVATMEEVAKIVEVWDEFASCYAKRITFLNPEIRAIADSSAPLGPDD